MPEIEFLSAKCKANTSPFQGSVLDLGGVLRSSNRGEAEMNMEEGKETDQVSITEKAITVGGGAGAKSCQEPQGLSGVIHPKSLLIVFASGLASMPESSQTWNLCKAPSPELIGFPLLQTFYEGTRGLSPLLPSTHHPVSSIVIQ